MRPSFFNPDDFEKVPSILTRYERLAKQRARLDFKESSQLINIYGKLLKTYFDQADPTDELYSRIHRIYDVLPQEEETTEHSFHPKTYYIPFEQQISIYRRFLEKLNALEKANTEKRDELRLELNLHILRYHPILYHLNYVVSPRELQGKISKEERYQVSDALEDFTKKLDNECFIDERDDNYRICLKTQDQLTQCFFLLSLEEKYVDTLAKALANTNACFREFPTLPAQLAMVRKEFENFLFEYVAVSIKETDNHSNIQDTSNSFNVIIQPYGKASRFSGYYFELAIALRTELFPADMSLSFNNAPTLSSTYIYALLTCCNDLNPCGALLAAIDLLQIVYNKSSHVNLKLADLLAENLKKILGNLTKFFPGISSLVYSLFLFSHAQLMYLKQPETSQVSRITHFKEIVAQNDVDDMIEVTSPNNQPGFDDASKKIFENAMKGFRHFREYICEETLDNELAYTGFTFQKLLADFLIRIERISDVAKEYLLPILAKSDALQRDILSLQLESLDPFTTRTNRKQPTLIKSLSN